MPNGHFKARVLPGRAAIPGSAGPLLGVSLLAEEQFGGLEQQVLAGEPLIPICLHIPPPPPDVFSHLPSGCCQGETARHALPPLSLTCLSHIFSRGLQGPGILRMWLALQLSAMQGWGRGWGGVCRREGGGGEDLTQYAKARPYGRLL